ncbi:MAG TPA: hypothetical protein ACQGQX_06720, partial [Xylella taiwanensis]
MPVIGFHIVTSLDSSRLPRIPRDPTHRCSVLLGKIMDHFLEIRAAVMQWQCGRGKQPSSHRQNNVVDTSTCDCRNLRHIMIGPFSRIHIIIHHGWHIVVEMR